jgi:hypothetical protein
MVAPLTYSQADYAELTVQERDRFSGFATAVSNIWLMVQRGTCTPYGSKRSRAQEVSDDKKFCRKNVFEITHLDGRYINVEHMRYGR